MTNFVRDLVKAQIADIIKERPPSFGLPRLKDREAFEATLAVMRKDELALMEAQSLEGIGSLPTFSHADGFIVATDSYLDSESIGPQ
jgi:hypothetical protein